VAIASAEHAVSDSRLVAELRADGVSTPGALVDVTHESADGSGDPTIVDVATLTFVAGGGEGLWQTTDPSIGGRPLPLDQADPADTFQALTVVYLPTDPDVAAAGQQLAGSVWHGAPTANEITGVVFTLALAPLILTIVIRVRRRRWLRDAGLHDLLIAGPG
jgi:hypothetical protein